MRYFETASRRFASGRDRVFRVISWLGAAVLSNRGLAVLALLACVLLAQGPWMRPPVTRDFRGGQIPWSTAGGEWFLPQSVAPTPRPWRWDSVAVPLLAISAGGALLVAFRPKKAPLVFGLVLAVSLPATAAAMWNHPTVVDFFETELRGRSLLRLVFRTENRDLLVGDSPDRLAQRRGNDSDSQLVPTDHPLMMPFRYTLFGGPWLIAISAAGVGVTCRGSLGHRLGSVTGWSTVGVLVAAAITAPRLTAEYHWQRAGALEQENRFEQAEARLELARGAMPELAMTRRYWAARGRLDYRQDRSSRFRKYFEAHQLGMARRYGEAHALLSEAVNAENSELVEQELLAEFLSELAARDARRDNYTSAERQWGEAAALVPWTPVYGIGHDALALWGDPERAAEIERSVATRMEQVGDRVLKSDIASIVGDAYFRIGDFREARAMYALSLANYNLPKHVNLHAQFGRLGM